MGTIASQIISLTIFYSETGEFPAQMASNAENFPFDDVTVEKIKLMKWNVVLW